MEYLSHNLWLVWTVGDVHLPHLRVVFGRLLCYLFCHWCAHQHSCGIGRSTFLGAGSGLGNLLHA